MRELRPAVFIETGVLHGMLSAFVLEAMRVNGHGRLISIDLPSYPESGPANVDGYQGMLPPGRQPGWLVPDELRDRWDLRLGRSLELLPAAIADAAGELDVFLHDSDHTHETMTRRVRAGLAGAAPRRRADRRRLDRQQRLRRAVRVGGRGAAAVPQPQRDAPRRGPRRADPQAADCVMQLWTLASEVASSGPALATSSTLPTACAAVAATVA